MLLRERLGLRARVPVRTVIDRDSPNRLILWLQRYLPNRTGIALTAFPADWGPNEKTGRVADLSPGLMADLRIETDDQVEVVFPYKEEGGTKLLSGMR